MKTKKIWITRDKEGDLFVFDAKPIRNKEYGIFVCDKHEDNCREIEEEPSERFDPFYGLFPDLTWENSPIEFVLKENEDEGVL